MREALGEKKWVNTDLFCTQCKTLVVDVFNLNLIVKTLLLAWFILSNFRFEVVPILDM